MEKPSFGRETGESSTRLHRLSCLSRTVVDMLVLELSALGEHEAQVQRRNASSRCAVRTANEADRVTETTLEPTKIANFKKGFRV